MVYDVSLSKHIESSIEIPFQTCKNFIAQGKPDVNFDGLLDFLNPDSLILGSDGFLMNSKSVIDGKPMGSFSFALKTEKNDLTTNILI